jgi:hypothetical protein
MLWKYITPNTYITLQPEYTQESLVYNFHYAPQDAALINGDNIRMNYLKGEVSFLEQATHTSENVTYILTPARGEVSIYNLLPYELKLIKDTKIVTVDGVVYKIMKDVKMYASDGKNPTNTKVPVIALEYQEDGKVIGERWNIETTTMLLIKNLKESTIDKKVYAYPIKKFTWWSTKTQWKVVEKDIQDFQKKMTKSVYQKKTRIIQERKTKNQDLYLMFDDLIQTVPMTFKHNVQVGDANPFIEGTLAGKLQYFYIPATTVLQAIQVYLKERNSPYTLLHTIDLSSIQLFEKKEVGSGVYEIPTKITLIRGYNFNQDPNAIISEIRERIKGLSFDEAREIIYGYEGIAKVEISNSPFWFRSISENPERIQFFLDEKK